MKDYIAGNREAWEEAFDNRREAWGADIETRIAREAYAFFNEDTAKALAEYELAGKSVGQFCCNNGRELLSLVKSARARDGVGFDIARNMISFAREKAASLELPCEFVATNILNIGEEYRERFDFVLITIGALCWFKDLDAYFKIVSRCTKRGGTILIKEQHPAANMLACPDEEGFDPLHPLNFVYSYFEHEWISNEGMGYIAGKSYPSKTFTDYTHPLSDIIGALCKNGFVITGMKEFDYDISDGFEHIDRAGFPLSILIQGKKE